MQKNTVKLIVAFTFLNFAHMAYAKDANLTLVEKALTCELPPVQAGQAGQAGQAEKVMKAVKKLGGINTNRDLESDPANFYTFPKGFTLYGFEVSELYIYNASVGDAAENGDANEYYAIFKGVELGKIVAATKLKFKSDTEGYVRDAKHGTISVKLAKNKKDSLLYCVEAY
jgi:hypothetical protein